MLMDGANEIEIDKMRKMDRLSLFSASLSLSLLLSLSLFLSLSITYTEETYFSILKLAKSFWKISNIFPKTKINMGNLGKKSRK